MARFVEWRPVEHWLLKAAYSYLEVDVESNQTSIITEALVEGVNPEHQLSLRSNLDLNKNLKLDLWLRDVDVIKAKGHLTEII